MEIVAIEIERGPRRPEAHLDLRVLPRELAEPGQQPALQEFARHAEIQHAADPFAADALDGAAQLVEAAPDAGQQLGAFLGQRDRAGVTAEQRHADVGFERLDLRADRRGRDAEFACRGREAEVGRHRLEDSQGVQRQTVGGSFHRTALINQGLTIRTGFPRCKA